MNRNNLGSKPTQRLSPNSDRVLSKRMGADVKYITWTSLLFMPLSTYAIPIQGMTIGDVAIGLAVLFMIFNILIKNNMKISFNGHLLLFILFIIMMLLIQEIFSPKVIRINFLSISRYLLYIVYILLSATNYYNNQYGFRVYRVLVFAFTIYLLMQHVALILFNSILPSTFFGLPSYAAEMTPDSFLKSGFMYRPRSVFLEPAHYAAYQLPALYLILNSEIHYTKHRYLLGAFISLGLVFSGSSTGILMLLFCWFRPAIMLVKKMNLKALITIILLLIGSTLIFNMDYVQRAIGRFWTSDGFFGPSFEGRFGNYLLLKNSGASEFNKMFGLGFGYKIGEYLPSYGTMVLYMGNFGLLVFFIIMAHAYYRSSSDGKGLLLLSLILFTGTNTLFGIAVVHLFTLIYSEIETGTKIKPLSAPY